MAIASVRNVAGNRQDASDIRARSPINEPACDGACKSRDQSRSGQRCRTHSVAVVHLPDFTILVYGTSMNTTQTPENEPFPNDKLHRKAAADFLTEFLTGRHRYPTWLKRCVVRVEPER
jgi:hypothetical protein